MALVEFLPKTVMTTIQKAIKDDVDEFKKLNNGTKAGIADQLYIENRIYKQGFEFTMDTVERLSEEKELLINKNEILKAEINSISYYDEEKIAGLVSKNPVIRSNNRERFKKELLKTLKINNEH